MSPAVIILVSLPTLLDLVYTYSTDRELFLVPRKGRPLMRCLHCRKERKKRAAHIACGCGPTPVTKEKCIHLRDADLHSAEHSGSEYERTAEECPTSVHGDTRVNAGTTLNDGHVNKHCAKTKVKPRLSTAHSESHVGAFSTGVHKPAHRQHDITRSKSLQRPQIHMYSARLTEPVAHRSMDDLTTASCLQVLDPRLTSAAGSTRTSTLDDTCLNDDVNYANTMYCVGPDLSRFETLYSKQNTVEPPMLDIPNTAATQVSDPWVTSAGWDSLDWGGCADGSTLQPALTYASSNALSEVEQTTPQDYTAVGGANAFLNDGTSQAMNMSTTSALFQAKLDDASSTSRWSLPASFFGNTDFGFDATDFDSMLQQGASCDWMTDTASLDQSGQQFTTESALLPVNELETWSDGNAMTNEWI